LWLRLALYTAVLLAFVVPPPEIYEGFSLCLIYNLFGVKCLTCGMTRAFAFAFHLNFAKAIDYNPLILLFFPAYLTAFLGDLASLVFLFFGKMVKSPAEQVLMRIDKHFIKW
jgi:hypothetical protein